MTGCIAILARANNCRRPITGYEGSGDDSHALAMRVGSLASAHPCNSDTWSSPSPDNTLLRARHCQSGFTPQGWPLTHADLMNWQVHARLGTPYTSEVEQFDSELFAPCLVQHPTTSHDGELAHCQTFEGEFCPEGKFTLGSDIFSNNSMIAERYYPVSVTAH